MMLSNCPDEVDVDDDVVEEVDVDVDDDADDDADDEEDVDKVEDDDDSVDVLSSKQPAIAIAPTIIPGTCTIKFARFMNPPVRL